MGALLRRRSMIAAGGSSPTPPGPTPEFHSYLVFDGASGIETGISIPENSSIRVSLGSETQKVQQGVFGAGGSAVGGYSIRLFYSSSTSSTNRNMAVVYDSTSYIAARNLPFSSTNYTFFMTPNGYGWGAGFYSYTKGSFHPTTGLVVGHDSGGLRYTGRTGTIRIYGSDAAGCQTSSAFDSYTPIITLRPCTYAGEAGYWYVEGNRFLGKTLGDGTLTVID